MKLLYSGFYIVSALAPPPRFSGYRMDDARVNHALNELKSARERLANLEKDQVALADRLAAARRAQRRIGFYLFGLVILFSLVMAGAFTLLL